jgi:hypothetical protein
MRALFDGLLTAGLLAAVGYVLQSILPNSSAITIEWQTQQYLIPYNIAAFWGCVALGVILGFIQTIRILFRDVERLQ